MFSIRRARSLLQPVHSRLAFRYALVRAVSGGSNLTDDELREDLQRLIRKATRDELLDLYKSAPRIPPDPRKEDRVRTLSEHKIHMEFKAANPNPYASGCYALKDFAEGEVICPITGELSATPTFESIQIGPHLHLDMARPSSILNHSCDPNGFIDFAKMQYRALRPIKKGEQLTWNYNTSEWELKRPFQCLCGKHITGFKCLDANEKSKLFKYLSPYLRPLAEQEARKEKEEARQTERETEIRRVEEEPCRTGKKRLSVEV